MVFCGVILSLLFSKVWYFCSRVFALWLTSCLHKTSHKENSSFSVESSLSLFIYKVSILLLFPLKFFASKNYFFYMLWFLLPSSSIYSISFFNLYAIIVYHSKSCYFWIMTIYYLNQSFVYLCISWFRLKSSFQYFLRCKSSGGELQFLFVWKSLYFISEE